MKYLLLALALALSPQAQAKTPEARETGGTFVDRRPLPALMDLKADLVKRLRVLPRTAFEDFAVPADWSPQRIADVIENLKVDSSPQSLNTQADGRLKMLTYDRDQQSISVLASFFLYYGREMTKASGMDLDVRDEIRQTLIHEVSHLWGFDDEMAEKFAERMVWGIDHDALVCNANYLQKDGKEREINYRYDFGSGRVYISEGHKDLSNDGSLPSVDGFQYYTMTFATVSFTDDTTIVTMNYSVNGDVLRMSAKRALDHNFASEGLFEFTNLNGGVSPPVQKTYCVAGVPRGPVADYDE